jgi:hypothetical protein
MNPSDSMMDDEKFPLPISITKTDFKQFDCEKIDEFLYKNHRYTSIDILAKELTELKKELNQMLLDLVNDDYNDFIDLGKSINDSYDYINYIMNDLNKFKSDLSQYHEKFNQTIENIDKIIENRLFLIKIKTLTKINLLLNDLINNFEISLDSNDCQLKLNQLTGFHLAITNLFKYLQNQSNEFDDFSNPFINNYLIQKISSINLEFKSYLRNCLIKVKQEKNGKELLELLNIYKIIGKEVELISSHNGSTTVGW